MNKVQQINLGGVPFTIDEDAFEHLRRYLDTIHRHFRESQGYEEITQDIEARLAELFQESLGRRTIVSLSDVKDAIVIMGTPEDFGAEPIEEETAGASTAGERQYKTGRRLFRDPEEEVLGGVCSGIAAYVGISDPLWIRLLFIVLTITSGFGIPAYLILWAIVPQAKTASDRLAMRGEPINASNIGRIIEEEVEHISQKVSELGGKKKGQNGSGSELSRILREIVAFIGKVLRIIIDILGKLWKPLLIFVGIAFVFAFIAAWVAAVSGGIYFWPYVDYFAPASNGILMLGAFNLLIVIGMVLMDVALLITRLLYGTRMSKPWRNGLAVFWVLNIVSLVFVMAMFAREFHNGASVQRQVPLSSLRSDTLSLEMGADYQGEAHFDIDNELIMTDDALLTRNFDIRIRKGDGAQFEVKTELSSRGPTQAVAERYALATDYEAISLGDNLVFPPYLKVPQGNKWRAQEVDVELRVPVGKYIRFMGENPFFIDEADKVDYRPRIYDNPGSTWEMTEDGLKCLDCQEE